MADFHSKMSVCRPPSPTIPTLVSTRNTLVQHHCRRQNFDRLFHPLNFQLQVRCVSDYVMDIYKFSTNFTTVVVSVMQDNLLHCWKISLGLSEEIIFHLTYNSIQKKPNRAVMLF